MATWTRRQIGQVSGLKTSAWLDEYSIVSTGGNALEWTKNRLCRMFITEARTFAVEVHAADVQYRESQTDDEERQNIRRIDAYWQPATHEIELRGGEKDGEILAVRDVWQPVVFAVSRPVEWFSESLAPSPTSPAFDRVTYEMQGWREDERRWVFATGGS